MTTYFDWCDGEENEEMLQWSGFHPSDMVRHSNPRPPSNMAANDMQSLVPHDWQHMNMSLVQGSNVSRYTPKTFSSWGKYY
jgi:hypothetical protein